MTTMNKQLPPIFQNPQAEGSSFFWKGSQSKGVLLLHGFTATTIEVQGMAKELNKDGYSVKGLLLPGHGISPQDLNAVKSKEWIDCVETGLGDLKKECETIFVAGESMGGLLSILLAARHPEIAGILLFAPALRIPKLWKANFVWPFKKYVYKKNVDLTTSWQGFNVVPLHAGRELLHLQSLVRSRLKDVKNPVILFQGKRDQTIDPMSSVYVLEHIQASDKQLVWIEEATHCIMMDPQFPVIYPMIKEFIQLHG